MAEAPAAGSKHQRQMPSTAPPVQVVHCFGTCAHNLRENICLLEGARVAYPVGTRVAITEAEGNADKLTFLSMGLRVRCVSAVACSPDKRFVAVCYKALKEPLIAYATIYHIPTKPQPSRVKTLSYERERKERQGPVEDEGLVAFASGDVSREARAGNSKSKNNNDSVSEGLTHVSADGAAEFVNTTFSSDARLLLVLDGHPEWTLLWFEWNSGNRIFTLPMGCPVYRMAFSPIDESIVATAGDNGHFRIWRTHGGKVTATTANDAARTVSWGFIMLPRKQLCTTISTSKVGHSYFE